MIAPRAKTAPSKNVASTACHIGSEGQSAASRTTLSRTRTTRSRSTRSSAPSATARSGASSRGGGASNRREPKKAKTTRRRWRRTDPDEPMKENAGDGLCSRQAAGPPGGGSRHGLVRGLRRSKGMSGKRGADFWCFFERHRQSERGDKQRVAEEPQALAGPDYGEAKHAGARRSGNACNTAEGYLLNRPLAHPPSRGAS